MHTVAMFSVVAAFAIISLVFLAGNLGVRLVSDEGLFVVVYCVALGVCFVLFIRSYGIVQATGRFIEKLEAELNGESQPS